MHTSTSFLRCALLLVVVAGLLVGCGKSKEAPAGSKDTLAADKADTSAARASGGEAPLVAPPSDPAAKTLLQEALATSKTFNSFHASGTMNAGGQVSTLEADLGQGSISVIVHRPDGKTHHYIVIGKDAFASTDGDATWNADGTNAGGRISQMITLPVQMMADATDQGPVSIVGKETVDGVEATHLKVAAETPINIWVAEDATLGTYVKRVSTVIEATDATINTDVVFSNINKPVDIKRP